MKIKQIPLQYIEQSAKKLTYLFIMKPVKLKDNFKIICKKKYITNLGRLVVSILGESHSIQFKNSAMDLTEILACVNDKHLYSISEKFFPIKNLKNKLSYRYKDSSFSYSFMLKKERFDYSTVNKLLAEIRTFNSHKSLLFEWYDKNDLKQPKIPSFTFINYKLFKHNLLRINTLHFYKNELLLIATSSKIKVKQPRGMEYSALLSPEK